MRSVCRACYFEYEDGRPVRTWRRCAGCRIAIVGWVVLAIGLLVLGSSAAYGQEEGKRRHRRDLATIYEAKPNDSCSSNESMCLLDPFDPSIFGGPNDAAAKLAGLEAIVARRRQADDCCHAEYYGEKFTSWKAKSCTLGAHLQLQHDLHFFCAYHWDTPWCDDMPEFYPACCEPAAFSPRDYETEAEAWTAATAQLIALQECCEENYALESWQYFRCHKDALDSQMIAEIEICLYWGCD